MAISLDTFFKAAANIRYVGADKDLDGDKTTIQFGLNPENLVAHKWETLGSRHDAFKAANQRLRQELYTALTQEFGCSLESLPKAVRDQLKLDDFLVKNGTVTSQRPLTLRRIEAIGKVVRTRELETRILDWAHGLSASQKSTIGLDRLEASGATPEEQRAWAKSFLADRPNLAKYLDATPTKEAVRFLNDRYGDIIESSVGSGKKSEFSVNGFAGTFIRELSRRDVGVMKINGVQPRQERKDKTVDVVGTKTSGLEAQQHENVKAVMEQLAELLPEQGMRHFVTSIISHDGFQMSIGLALAARDKDPGKGIKGGPGERIANDQVMIYGSDAVPQEIHLDIAEDGAISIRLKAAYCYKLQGNDPLLNGVGVNLELARYPVEAKITIPGGQHIAVGEIPKYKAEITA